MIWALISVMITATPWSVRIAVAVVTLFVLLLLFSIFTRTHYTIAHGELRVVSGPFRRTVPLAEITSIEPSRNPLSSPALSLDRLKVSYGDNKYILISPADKTGFLSAVEDSTMRGET
jgi:membrane protein YdbS with pleckstrin-like domain